MGGRTGYYGKTHPVARQNAPRPTYATCIRYFGNDLYCGNPTEGGKQYCPECRAKIVSPVGTSTLSGGSTGFKEIMPKRAHKFNF